MSDVLKAARAKHAKLTAEAKALEAFIRLGEKLISGQTPDAYLKPQAAPSAPQKASKAVDVGDALSRRLGALRDVNVA